MVEHVVYINLAHRTDRRESIESVLSCFPKVERINAIRENPGFVGVTKSHIIALQHAITKGWDHVLIVEDDMVWINYEKYYPILLEQMKKPYDVIVLGGMLVDHDASTRKLFQCNGTGGYLVHRNYYKTLLDNFIEGLNLLTHSLLLNAKKFGLAFPIRNTLYRIDIWWHSLQKRDNWYILPMMYSPDGFSDVSQTEVKYSNLFLKE
jgi:glycosyl transferase family 25